MATPARISKRKLANPVQAPPDLGYNDPVLEAQAREIRYISLSVQELVGGDAPIQMWTTKRPISPPAYEAGTVSGPTSPLSSSGSSSSGSQRLDLASYLAKIPTSNDRAVRGKLDRIGSTSPDDIALAYKEPDTPSSLPPRNTAPKNVSPTYIPPGRRGSRVSSNIDDQRQPEAPLVQAPLPKRSYSSTTAQSLHAVRRSVSLRRTASADMPSSPTEPEAIVPFAPAPSSRDAPPAVASKRGRPRKVHVRSDGRPISLEHTWNSKKVIETPLVSPSTSSISTGPASTAEESALDEEGDEVFDDDEDDSYTPPVSHKKTSRSPPTSASPKGANKAQRKPRKGNKSGSQHGVSRAAKVAILDHSAQPKDGDRHELSSSSFPVTIKPAEPAMGSFTDRKRQFSDMSSSDDLVHEQPPYQKLRLGRPLTLTLKHSGFGSSSIPKLHSPLSQSFHVGRDESAVNRLSNHVHRVAPSLPVS